jgi:SAM-dependent methyltransferase
VRAIRREMPRTCGTLATLMQTSSALPVDYDVVWNEVYGDMQDVGPVHRHMRRLVGEMLAALDYDSVLEVGCGAGHNLELLSRGRPGLRLAGADISSEALERARRIRPEGDFTMLDIQTETPPTCADLVFSSLVLEHLPDDLGALRRMRSACDRYLLLTTIAGSFERYRPWEEQMGHVRNYRHGELEDKLARTGFAVRRALYWGFPFYTPLARTLQNRMTSEPSYGRGARLLAEFLYRLYFLNSRRRGDLLIVLAEAVGEGAPG